MGNHCARGLHAEESPMRNAMSMLTPLAVLVGYCCIDSGVVTAANPPPRLPLLVLSPLDSHQRVVTAANPPPRLPRDQLLVYRGPGGKPVAVKTPDDWAKRRAE